MGGEMKIHGFVLNGVLINIGPWDYRSKPETRIEYEEIYHGEKLIKRIPREVETGNIIHMNPLPEGAIDGEFDVEETERGRITLSSDYKTLRHDAYPSIADQLDALWKGGEDIELMREKVMAVKNRYPKNDPS